MKTIDKITKTKTKLDFLIKKLELELSENIEFKFSIIHQASDGWCILDLNEANLAPLDLCISIISKKGSLSFSDFKDTCV